jgi:TP901 family phage tail tape measure protein
MAQVEIARAQVYLDGESAAQELAKLTGRAKELRSELAKAFSANDAAAVKKYENELNNVNREMKGLQKSTFDVEKVLNNLNGSSINDLAKAQRKLNAEIKSMPRSNPEEVAALNAKKLALKGVNKELSEAKAGMNGMSQAQKGWLGSLSGGISKFMGGIAMITASVTGTIFAMSRAKDAANEYEEALGNLSALTGLQGKDLDWLSEKAKATSVSVTKDGIRIRQSAKDILDAYTIVGSQRPELLGNKEALAAVTEQAIILSEAGKIQLEPAVTALTNTLNQFNLEGSEAARVVNIIAAGSKVGAADIDYVSTAIEKAGTTANLMGISVEQSVGMIEAIGPKFANAAEAGNGLDKVMLKMREKNIGYKDGVFDMNRALEELSVRFANGESSTAIFGVEHAKMAEVLVQGREEMRRYTKEVTGTSVAIEQAGINTDTNKAKLAQAQNELSLVAIKLGSDVAPAFTFATHSMAGMGNALIGLIKFLNEYRGIIVTGAAAVAAYALVVNAAAIAKGLYSAATWVATTATKAFNAVMKSNPWGLLASVIAGALVGLIAFSRNMKSISAETKAQTNLNNALAESISKELGPMTQLFDQLKSVSISSNERKETIKQLNDQYGKYLPSLLTEKSTLQEIEAAQNAANIALEQSITKKVRAQVLGDLLTAKIKAQMDLERLLKDKVGDVGIETLIDGGNEAKKIIDKNYQDELTAADLQGKKKEDLQGKQLEKYLQIEADYTTNIENLRKTALTQDTFNEDKDIAKARKELDDVSRQFLATQDLINEALQREGGTTATATAKVPVAPVVPGETAEEKAKREELIKKEQEYRDQLILDAMSLTDRENVEYKKRLENAGINLNEVGALTEEKQRALEILDQQHAENNKKIESNALSNKIQDNEKNFELETTNRQAAHFKELAALGTNQNARAALQKKFDKEDEERQLAHMQGLVAQLQGALEGEDTFEGIDEKLLTEEEKQKLIADLAAIGLAYEELKAKISGKEEDKKPTKFQIFAGGDASKVDIFGMSGADWKTMLENIKDGKIGLDDIVNAIGAIQNAWAMVNEIRANQEARAMQDYESSIEKRKQLLQKQLDSGQISQESYNKQIAAMDADLDKKKKELAIKQAKREKSMALVSAIVNTASAIVKALNTQPVWVGIVMAALVGIMGGLQIAKIVSTPLPQAAKGKYNVIGADDGKTYNAPIIDSPGTGLVNSPAIIVGEQPEIIIDPYTTRNMQMNFPELIEGINIARVQQHFSGKYSSDFSSIPGTAGSIKETLEDVKKTMLGLQSTTANLQATVEKLVKEGVQASLVTNGEYMEKHNKVAKDYAALQKQSSLRG